MNNETLPQTIRKQEFYPAIDIQMEDKQNIMLYLFGNLVGSEIIRNFAVRNNKQNK